MHFEKNDVGDFRAKNKKCSIGKSLLESARVIFKLSYENLFLKRRAFGRLRNPPRTKLCISKNYLGKKDSKKLSSNCDTLWFEQKQ